jgi:PII-like signaling protein
MSARGVGAGELAAARAQQLVELVVADPVVLVVVDHRQQHVQMLQEILGPGPPSTSARRRTGSEPTR